MKTKTLLCLGSLFLCIAVILGAFGAHGLNNSLSLKQMATFKTGVTYQFYHGFALLILGILSKTFKDLKTQNCGYFFTFGIIIFSFNCYIYAISGVKGFALIIPIGGILFILGWLSLFWKCLKYKG